MGDECWMVGVGKRGTLGKIRGTTSTKIKVRTSAAASTAAWA